MLAAELYFKSIITNKVLYASHDLITAVSHGCYSHIRTKSEFKGTTQFLFAFKSCKVVWLGKLTLNRDSCSSNECAFWWLYITVHAIFRTWGDNILPARSNPIYTLQLLKYGVMRPQTNILRGGCNLEDIIQDFFIVILRLSRFSSTVLQKNCSEYNRGRNSVNYLQDSWYSVHTFKEIIYNVNRLWCLTIFVVSKNLKKRLLHYLKIIFREKYDQWRISTSHQHRISAVVHNFTGIVMNWPRS